MVPNQPENGKYNLISVRINKLPKSFLCVYMHRTKLVFIITFPHAEPGNTTTIRLIAVGEIDASLHHGRPIEGLHYSTIVLTGLRGALNWDAIMPRDVSFWDSKYAFFSSQVPCPPHIHIYICVYIPHAPHIYAYFLLVFNIKRRVV